jgi:hypothetical protein
MMAEIFFTISLLVILMMNTFKILSNSDAFAWLCLITVLTVIFYKERGER